MGKYLVIRSCFRDASLYKEGQVKELSDEMAQKHPKDFQLIGQEPKPRPEPTPLPEAPKPVSSPEIISLIVE